MVDSEDLPLNISREMLQHNPMLAKIRSGIVRRVLGDLAKKAEDAEQAEAYATFWENFGAVLKEGLYEDYEHREQITKLLRFRTTGAEGLVSLDDYIGRMKEGQDAIFYITGDDIDTLRRSPQIEGFKARGVEVLLLTDPVDEFWIPSVAEYKDKKFKSVTRGGADLSRIKAENEPEKPEEEKPAENDLGSLLAALKLTLADAVKDVRVSERLTDSPVCLVADEGDMDMHLERLLKQHRQLDTSAQRILEVNPTHPLIRRLTDLAAKDGVSAGLEDVAWLLLDQARIVEGEQIPDPAAFARRLAVMLEKGLLTGLAPVAVCWVISIYAASDVRRSMGRTPIYGPLIPFNLQPEHLDPLAPAAQAADADGGQGHAAAAFLGRGGSRQDDDFGLALQACAQFLDSRRRVHAVADDRVVDPAGRADIADDHRAAVQADSHPDRRQPDGAALRVVSPYRRRDFTRGPQGPRRMVLLDLRRSPERHDGVADELVHRAAFRLDAGGQQGEVAVQQRRGLRRPQILRQRAEAPDVGEHHRHLPLFRADAGTRLVRGVAPDQAQHQPLGNIGFEPPSVRPPWR